VRGVSTKRKIKKIRQSGRNVIKRVPHRNVGGVNLPGYLESKMWESHIEQAVITALSLCHDISNIRTQETTLTYEEYGVTRTYAPDLTFEYQNRIVVCEAKKLRWLLEIETRLDLVKYYKLFNIQGLLYHFITEDQVKHEPFFSNIETIISYKSHFVPQEKIDLYLKVIGDQCLTLGEILNFPEIDDDKASIYACIFNKHLHIDWNNKLSNNAVIYPTSNNHRGLSYEQVITSGEYGHILQELVLEGGQKADRVLAIKKSEERQIRNYNPLGFF